jgi:hypothetical protein
MPKPSSKPTTKLKQQAVDDSQLQLLKNYSSEALARIWKYARNLLMARNRSSGIQGKNGNLTYKGPVISCISLDKVALSRLQSYRDEGLKVKHSPIQTMTCYGECYHCPFAVEDLDREWYCTLPQAKVNIVDRPEPPKRKRKKANGK